MAFLTKDKPTTMTNTNELSKNLAIYVANWALLANWDTTKGGERPKASHIADAIAVMSKPGGKPAVLNQGLRALALGFRPSGSTDGERAYASMSGQPHNNVGKLGDALRTAYKSSRLDVGRDYAVTLPGGIVTAKSNKAGHIQLTVTERFAAPVAATPSPATDKPAKAKGKGKSRKAKAAKVECPVMPVDGIGEQTPSLIGSDGGPMSEAELDALTAPSEPIQAEPSDTVAE
jgi:hypothetical protein